MVDRVAGYEIQGWVARSDTGGLCRARDLELDRVVALKHVAGTTGPAAKRLRGEARMLAGLSHPHLVSVFDLLENDAGLWLVEEWVEGADLRSVVAQAGRLSATQGIAVVHGALQGLAYAHERGVVHADITLRNILVDVGGVSKLVDFGLARRTATAARRPDSESGSSQHPRETILGTPGLVSPQVVSGRPATPADDVYSAGAVLAALLLGRSLFAGATVQAVLADQRREAPNLAGITSGVRSVLARALTAEPTERYPDAGGFLAALDEAAERDHGAAWLAEAGLAALVAGVGAGAATTVLHSTLTASTTATGQGAPQLKPVAARTARRPIRPLSRATIATATAAVMVVAGATVVVARSRHEPPTPPPAPAPVVNAALPSATPIAPTTPAAPSPTSLGPVVWAGLRQVYNSGISVNDVSCPTDDFCVAAAGSGRLRTFKERTSSGVVTIKTVAGDAVPCASPAFCVAGTGDGDVTRWNGTSWSQPRRFVKSAYNVTDVSCPTVDFCMVAGPTVMATWDGKGWSKVRLPGDQKSLENYRLSCVSRQFCAVTAESDEDPPFVSTWNGAGWSRAKRLTTSTGRSHLSCATESFCMLVVDDRYLVWDGSTWSKARPISPANGKALADVSCPEAGFCEIITSGDSSSATTGQVNQEFVQVREGSSRASTWNGRSWSGLKKVNSRLTAPSAISCASSTFCAVGEVIAG